MVELQAGAIVKCNECDLTIEVEQVISTGVLDPYIIGHTSDGEPARISVASCAKIAESKQE